MAAGSDPLRPTDTQVPQTPTTLRGLIGAVTTVVVVVADKVLGDALPVPTHELPLITGVVVHCNGAPSPSPLAPAIPWPPPNPPPSGTHSSQQRGSHRPRPRSPCPRHRASAPARTHRCLGTGKILSCTWSALEEGEEQDGVWSPHCWRLWGAPRDRAQESDKTTSGRREGERQEHRYRTW